MSDSIREHCLLHLPSTLNGQLQVVNCVIHPTRQSIKVEVACPAVATDNSSITSPCNTAPKSPMGLQTMSSRSRACARRRERSRSSHYMSTIRIGRPFPDDTPDPSRLRAAWLRRLQQHDGH